MNAGRALLAWLLLAVGLCAQGGVQGGVRAGAGASAPGGVRASAGASAPGPTSLSLDGRWDLALDPRDRGQSQGWSDPQHPAWNKALSVQVPGVLESSPQTAGYDGVAWYRRRLPGTPPPGGREDVTLLEFDGVNGRADVWLDGVHLGRHDGTDAPFHFDVSGNTLGPDAWLVLRVVDPGGRQADGLLLGAMPHAKESWYFNYGGVTGSVRLRRAPPVEARLPEVLPPPEPGAPGRLRLSLVNHTAQPRVISLAAALAPDAELTPPPRAGATISASPGAPTGATTDAPTGASAGTPTGTPTGTPIEPPRVQAGVVSAQLVAPPGRSEVELPLPIDASLPWWSPAEPNLLPLQIALADGERLTRSTTRTGLRRMEVQDGRFVLNGETIRPWGVLWQPLFPAGLANPPDPGFLERELRAIKAAGFTLVRAHLRVVPELYALCDEIGLLVHAEPTLGWVTLVRDETWPLVDQALVTLADAVRGRPSVVLVGVLNELSGELHTRAPDLHARMGALLPGHLVLDDSGSWRGSAHLLGPGFARPEPCDDVHLYRAWPWSPDDFDHVASLGADHERLVYVSEYGFGGVPSLGSALAGYGAALWREDANLVLDDLTALQQALAGDALSQVAGDVDSVSMLGQLNQARAARLMTAALQHNPRVAGGVYTQWRDVSWECGAGLVDHWGQPKPALAAIASQLRPGSDAAPEELFAPAPPPRARRPVAVGSVVGLEGRLGELVGELVAGHGDNRHGLPRIAVVGQRPNPWGPEGIALTVALLRHVQAGGVVLMLAPPDAGRPLPQFFFGYDGLGQVADLPFDVEARAARGHFVGTHFAFRPGSLLCDDLALPAPLLDERFGAAKPHVVLETGPDVESRVELLCLDGYGLPLGAAVQSVRLGRGRLVLSTLRLNDETLSEPAVVRLAENLVRFAASEALGQPPPKDVLADAPDPALGDAIGRHLWRFKIAFGLMERLSIQRLNGERPRRDPPADLEVLTQRKVIGLQRILAGEVQQGVDVLGLADRHGLNPSREEFLRKEIELSSVFYGQDSQRSLVDTLDVGRLYTRALRLMRLGEARGAMNEVQHALTVVGRWDQAASTSAPDTTAPTPAVFTPAGSTPAGSTPAASTPASGTQGTQGTPNTPGTPGTSGAPGTSGGDG